MDNLIFIDEFVFRCDYVREVVTQLVEVDYRKEVEILFSPEFRVVVGKDLTINHTQTVRKLLDYLRSMSSRA